MDGGVDVGWHIDCGVYVGNIVHRGVDLSDVVDGCVDVSWQINGGVDVGNVVDRGIDLSDVVDGCVDVSWQIDGGVDIGNVVDRGIDLGDVVDGSVDISRQINGGIDVGDIIDCGVPIREIVDDRVLGNKGVDDGVFWDEGIDDTVARDKGIGDRVSGDEGIDNTVFRNQGVYHRISGNESVDDGVLRNESIDYTVLRDDVVDESVAEGGVVDDDGGEVCVGDVGGVVNLYVCGVEPHADGEPFGGLDAGQAVDAVDATRCHVAQRDGIAIRGEAVVGMQPQACHAAAVAAEGLVLHREYQHAQRGVVLAGGADDVAVATAADADVGRFQAEIVVRVLHVHLQGGDGGVVVEHDVHLGCGGLSLGVALHVEAVGFVAL